MAVHVHFTAFSRPCHAPKVDTSPTICPRFIDVTPIESVKIAYYNAYTTCTIFPGLGSIPPSELDSSFLAQKPSLTRVVMAPWVLCDQRSASQISCNNVSWVLKKPLCLELLNLEFARPRAFPHSSLHRFVYSLMQPSSGLL